MIRKMATSNGNAVSVAFELPSCLWADRIYLVGDFNGWNETATPMQQERDGIWRVVVDLPRGQRYEFRYLIDGQWTSDSHADGFVQNNFGVSNSVVHTSLPVATIPKSEMHLTQELAKEIPMRTVAPHHAYRITRPAYPARKR